MTSTSINRGNVATTILISASLTPTAVSATTSVEQSFAVPGLLSTDQISAIQLQAAWTVLVDVVNCRVSAANTLGISFQNSTGGSVTPPAGTYLIEVNRPKSVPLPSNAT